MLKLTIAIVAIALTGAASAAGWRDLRVDASSDEAFAQSLAAFKDRLSTVRQQVFGEALKDIWIEGVRAAEAEQRDYTAADYYRQVHGLGFDQIVSLTDPTGEKAKERYRVARELQSRPLPTHVNSPWPARPAPIGPTGEQRRGGNYTHPMQ